MNTHRSPSSTLIAFSSARPRGPAPVVDLAAQTKQEFRAKSVPSLADSPLRFGGRDRERALLDAWREAHWSLRLELEAVVRQCGPLGLEALYDEARRCDNLLNEFYQARAEVLERQLRELGEARVPSKTPPAPALGGVSHAATGSARRLGVTERALLARVRDMTPDDRAALLRLAVRMTAGPDDRGRR